MNNNVKNAILNLIKEELRKNMKEHRENRIAKQISEQIDLDEFFKSKKSGEEEATTTIDLKVNVNLCVCGLTYPETCGFCNRA